jgi:hypothetical protein
MCCDHHHNFIVKKGFVLCNSHAISHDIELLIMYNAHINIVICYQ